MRYVLGFLLLLFLGAVLMFAVQNLANTELMFLQWTITLPKAALIVLSYLLGMLSGWTVVNFVRYSLRRVQDVPPPRRN